MAQGRCPLLLRGLPKAGGTVEAARPQGRDLVSQRKYHGISGPELRAERKAAGLSQATLAERAGIGRHAVIYWEKKPERFWRGWAIGRMFKVLGLTVLSVYWTNTHARGDGVLVRDSQQDRLDRLFGMHLARVKARAGRYRQPCGAKTRKGLPCRLMSEPGKRRCKFHGGKSTGPRTIEGKERIAQAQKRRWAEWRESF